VSDRSLNRTVLACTVSAISFVLAVTAAELVLRWRAIGPIPPAGMSLHYRHDPVLGWRPTAGDRRTIVATRSFEVEHNADGFRDRAHGPKTRPRILFLGDSFVWGFDVDRRERFTDLVQDRLPAWDILNAGIAGYGTDQEYLLLTQIFDRYQPDLVFLMFCVDNDRQNNSANEAYGFMKPYFVRGDGGVTLQGTPVPQSEVFWFEEHPTLFSIRLTRAIAKVLKHPRAVAVPDPTLDVMGLIVRFLADRHVPLIVGLTADDPDLKRYLAAAKIAALDLSDAERYATFGSHWTPRGQAVVSRQVLETLSPFLAAAGAP
jgi:hypothetical protein